MMIECPLCKCNSHYLIEKIPSKLLLNAYNDLTGIIFDKLIVEDIKLLKCEKCSFLYYTPAIAGDEVFYESLQKFEWYYSSEKYEYLFASKFIKAGDLVLDVGCGRGAFSEYVEASGGIFNGIEFSQNAVDMAISNKINVFKGDILDFSSKNPKKYDVVTSFQVCEHVNNIFEFIQSQLDVLKIGGRIIIAVPSDDGFLSKVTNGILNMPPHHLNRWNREIFVNMQKIFNIKLLEIHHEVMQEQHSRQILSTLIENTILKPKLIDFSFKRTVVKLISSIIAKRLKKGFTKEFYPNGHTVIAVFEKMG